MLARSPSSALYPFLGEGSPIKTDYRKKSGTLILTSLLEDGYRWILDREGTFLIRGGSLKALRAIFWPSQRLFSRIIRLAVGWKHRASGIRGPGVDSPFLSNIVLFNNQPNSLASWRGKYPYKRGSVIKSRHAFCR